MGGRLRVVSEVEPRGDEWCCDLSGVDGVVVDAVWVDGVDGVAAAGEGFGECFGEPDWDGPVTGAVDEERFDLRLVVGMVDRIAVGPIVGVCVSWTEEIDGEAFCLGNVVWASESDESVGHDRRVVAF